MINSKHFKKVDDILLSQKEVCEILNISADQLRKLRRMGKITAYSHPSQATYGSRKYYKASEINSYIQSSLVKIND